MTTREIKDALCDAVALERYSKPVGIASVPTMITWYAVRDALDKLIGRLALEADDDAPDLALALQAAADQRARTEELERTLCFRDDIVRAIEERSKRVIAHRDELLELAEHHAEQLEALRQDVARANGSRDHATDLYRDALRAQDLTAKRLMAIDRALNGPLPK